LENGFEKKIKKGEKPQPAQPPGLSPAWLPFPAPSPQQAAQPNACPSPTARPSLPRCGPLPAGSQPSFYDMWGPWDNAFSFLSSQPNRTLPPADSIPGTTDFLALFANQAPIKLLLKSRSFRLHLSRENQALDALVKLGWISSGPTSFFSVVCAPRSPLDRTKRVDVLGVSFSSSARIRMF